ncbi:MAG TPA: hypothetical protein VKE42_13380 [Candidatus Cybelea sp.]|nr:hypothetical protein [Candidatus Cybelea sp.]
MTQDDDEIIRNGGKIRVPMMMMDSSRTVAIDYGDDPPAAHRPGFRRAADPAMRDASDKAYDAMLKRMSNAWKSVERREADAEIAAEAPLCEDPSEDAYQRYKKRMANAWRGS